MKLSVLLIMVFCMHVSAKSYSQSVTLSEKDAPIEKVFKSIKKQTGYVFFYDYSWLKQAQPININVKNIPLQKALDLCFTNQPLSYALVGKTVVIRPKNEVLPVQDTTVTVSGTVSDTKGTPLIGVSIKQKDRQGMGASTNNQGKYTFRVSIGSTLVFSYVGFKAQKIPVNGRNTINVVMQESETELNQVVVVGYGTSSKKDLTGAVGTVNVTELNKAPVGSFVEALAGRIAGVQVSSMDGQPGGSFNIQVRGPGSLTQNTSPLFVVDGFPVEDLDPNSLNTDDIESMSILKDASSAAIYGSRAANGVIIIQTKRGKVGKAKVTFNTSVGNNLKMKSLELMNPYEYVKYQNELFPGQAGAAEYIANTPLDYYKDVKGLDLQDYIFTTGALKKYDLGVRGGNEQTKYSISGSIVNLQGVVVNTGLDKYTARMTLDQALGKKLKVGLTGAYSSIKSFGQVISSNPSTSGISTSLSSYIMYRVWGYRPVTVPYIPQETLLDEADETAFNASDFRINPVADLENLYDAQFSNLLESNAYASYDILKNLTLRVAGGIRNRSGRNEGFYNSKTSKGSPGNPNNSNGINGQIRYSDNNKWSNANTLTYHTTFNSDHNFTGVALFEVSSEKTNANGYASRLIPNESLGMRGLDEGLTFNSNSSASANTMTSYGTRWNYNYKSKYLFSASFRADGSSKFIAPNKWGYFPAASVGWNMHEEGFFMKALPFVSNSKLRASYGVVGNNRVSDFAAYARLTRTTDGYGFNNQTPLSAANVTSIFNRDLRWEKTTSVDLGYEVGVLNNRVELVVDLYKKTTRDLLLNAPLPTSTGFSTAFKNVGSLGNKGIEFTLNTTNIANKPFSWTSSFNISFNRNTVLELASSDQTSLQSQATGLESQYNTPLYIAEIGKESGMMFGFVWDGNYQFADFDSPTAGIYVLKSTVPSNGSSALRTTIKPGDIKYKDLNHDGIIDVNDKTIIGKGQPIHTGGFTNNFNYKGVGLNVFFQWSYGNDIYNANRLTFEGNGNLRRNLNQYASYVNRWSPENQTNENYRAGGHGTFGMHSSRVVEDGSYLRLKTLSLDYSIPSRYIKKLYLSKLTLNVAAQNLLTWTNYSGLDPEVSLRAGVLTPGLDFSAYPQSRTIVFGLNAAF